MLKRFLLFLGLLALPVTALAAPTTLERPVKKPPLLTTPTPPTVNLSAIVQIVCDEGRGSGFIINKNVIVTALHVATLSNCKVRGQRVIMYHRDSAHDFALMTGNVDTPYYMKYSCAGYTPGEEYYARGYREVFREDKLRATKIITDESFVVGSSRVPFPGMRYLEGTIRRGMSGGPIADKNGYTRGIVNVGAVNIFGIEGPHSYSYELKDTILCQK